MKIPSSVQELKDLISSPFSQDRSDHRPSHRHRRSSGISHSHTSRRASEVDGGRSRPEQRPQHAYVDSGYVEYVTPRPRSRSVGEVARDSLENLHRRTQTRATEAHEDFRHEASDNFDEDVGRGTRRSGPRRRRRASQREVEDMGDTYHENEETFDTSFYDELSRREKSLATAVVNYDFEKAYPYLRDLPGRLDAKDRDMLARVKFGSYEDYKSRMDMSNYYHLNQWQGAVPVLLEGDHRAEHRAIEKVLDRHDVPFYERSLTVGQKEFSDDMRDAENLQFRPGTRLEDLEKRQTARLRRKYGPDHIFRRK